MTSMAIPAAASDRTAAMQAVVRRRYGSADVLALDEVARPELTDDGVLVRVRASSVNRGDWYGMEGKPLAGRAMLGLLRPKSPLLGGDFAGIVEAVGKDVTELQPGDEVFGIRSGAWAEYVCVRQAVVAKPANLTLEEAAAVPVAALTALQGLRDHGGVQPGQKVLIHGAGGGVGTFAVQIAKALGAHVTAVCSTRNVEQTRSLGADRVLDYTREDFTRSGGRYEVIFDNAGTRSWRACKRVLAPHSTVVLVGGPIGTVLGPLRHVGAMMLASKLGDGEAVFFVAKPNRPDLALIREWIEAGKVRPVVEREYPLGEIADALRYMGEEHVRGKLVLTMPR
jgi:NADPH:quinone reductase-like Zn-dependent oxidoreductase